MEQTRAPAAPVLRKDYAPTHFQIDTVELDFELHPTRTRIQSKLSLRRTRAAGAARAPLVLDGEALELVSVALDGKRLAPGQYDVDDEHLTLADVPDAFELAIEVIVNPEANTELSGLYRSGGIFCTQCEAEGFRRITYFLDRPDVMATYRVTLTGERESCPVLLSNGNRLAQEDLGDGRQRVRWEDPFKKPSYLFALVAGNLACRAGAFTTLSGREVRLEIWVEPAELEKTSHALESLQKAMRWDEQSYAREYDLDVYMIVAVSDFNGGAMENKGLNLFNSKYVLASPETATDDEYEAIEGVIAHEYFHNWTGNRVTLRDWFQLTLKEGLTVYRDQTFSADMTSAAVQRINDVKMLRLRQFPEDAGPTAHPIRPESYVEMQNFYTATVYEKGAEVIRMYATLLGRDGFRRGMDLYFERHDGEAVTCDDFRAAMADANGRDLSQFERWYLQAGTPLLEATGVFDAERRTYALTLAQVAPKGAGPDTFRPCQLPVRMGLVGRDGRDLPLRLAGGDGEAPTERVLELTSARETFVFEGLDARPVPSLLRDFSAPVELRMERSREDLAFLLANDSDAFQRWDAGQTLFGQAILALTTEHLAGRELTLDPLLTRAFEAVLVDPSIDGSMRALTLGFPPERELMLGMDPIHPGALRTAREFLQRSIAVELEGTLREVHAAHAPEGEYTKDSAAIDRRRTRNTALAYLTCLGTEATTELARAQFEGADNMSESGAALACLAATSGATRDAAFAAFHQRWKDDALMLDKWFQLQATAPLDDAPARVRALLDHDDYILSNPNRVRALVGAFAGANIAAFHDPSGEGYRILAGQILAVDPINAQVSAFLTKNFALWKRFEPKRRALMQGQLERLAGAPELSKNAREIVDRALA